MNAPLSVAFALIALASTVLPARADSSPSAASSPDGKIDLIAVAEQSPAGTKITRPTPEQPAYYVAYDGGYLETGGSVAGLKPPSAGVVGRALQTALASQGYRPASAQTPPSLVLIYHWGAVSRVYMLADSSTAYLTSLGNADANRIHHLSFVFPSRFNQLMTIKNPSAYPLKLKDSGLPLNSRGFVEGVDLDRNFVIVTAYDYAGLQRHEQILLWRVKLSAPQAGAEMADALPALLNAGATYFGRDFDKSQLGTASLLPRTGAETSDAAPFPPRLAGQDDEPLVRDLVARERNEFDEGPRHPVNDRLWTGKASTPPPADTGKGIPLIAVAEQTEPGAKLAGPAPGHPVYYLACDAGYIELGDPIAGIKPPASADVNRAFRSALDAAGYELATAQNAPAVVLVYHYGYLRRESYAARPSSAQEISRNIQASIEIIAPQKLAEQTVRYLVHGQDANAGFVRPDVRDTLEYADDPRYFVTVSAYDYADLTRQTPTLLWRAKLSAQDNSGPLDEIVPALAAACGPYLGRNFPERQHGSAPPFSGPDQRGSLSAAPPAFPLPRKAVEKIDARFLRQLLLQERTGGFAAPVAVIISPPVPPALAGRILAYQQAKDALQDALAAKLKAAAPGPDTRRAIDTFKSDNAMRIAALDRMRESIRGELAQLQVATSPPAADQQLDGLLREFATNLRQLEIPAANIP